MTKNRPIVRQRRLTIEHARQIHLSYSPLFAAAITAFLVVWTTQPVRAQSNLPVRDDSLAGPTTIPTRRGEQQGLTDLPIVEIQAPSHRQKTLAIFLSGDGGWADLTKKISQVLVSRGIDVVGIDLRTYLTVGRTPERTTDDVTRVAQTYMRLWDDTSLVLIGYSRGADIAPFVASRLSSALKSRTALVALLGLATRANFKFHLVDLVRDVERPTDLPIAPELQKLVGPRILCVYGSEEKKSGCREADSTRVQIIARPGGHHFDKNYSALGALIADALLR